MAEPQSQRPGLWSRVCRLIKPDWMFAFLLAVSVVLLVLGFDGFGEGRTEPLGKVAVIGSATLALAFLATLGQKLDRRLLDDYFYQLMAHGAIVAVITTFVLFALFDLFAGILPTLAGTDIIAVMMGSWALGFFFYRLRGTNL